MCYNKYIRRIIGAYMKKNTKKGFTLAELLISIAIISIISTMGIVISKKGMDNKINFFVVVFKYFANSSSFGSRPKSTFNLIIAFFKFLILSIKNKLCELNRIYNLAILINTHIS